MSYIAAAIVAGVVLINAPILYRLCVYLWKTRPLRNKRRKGTLPPPSRDCERTWRVAER